MTELKREIIALIESIPDENTALLAKILKNLREILTMQNVNTSKFPASKKIWRSWKKLKLWSAKEATVVTELKQEVLSLIAEIPDEKTDVFVKIRKSIRELLGVNSKSRAEKNLTIMDEVTNLIGDDIPWLNEDEMLRELAETRRQRLNA